MKFENTEVFNFKGAIRGMRMPFKGIAKLDSCYCLPNDCVNCKYSNCAESKDNPFHWNPCFGDDVEWTPYCIGEDDLRVAQKLVAAGSPNDKFMRQIFISMDIEANLKIWAQIDQYKIGTVTDSESVMHTITKYPITRDNFEQIGYDDSLVVFENYPYNPPLTIGEIWEDKIDLLETLRQRYNETKDIKYWKALVDFLPESYLQKRTWTANYAVARNIIKQRIGHKMDQWAMMVNHFRKFPYAKELLFYGLEKDDVQTV